MNKLKRGFTLIEIIIFVAVVGIVTTLGISAYSKSQDKQTMLQNSRNVESALKEAQKNAATGNIANSGCSAGHLLSYRATFPNNTTIRTRAQCKDGANIVYGTVKDTQLTGAIFVTYPSYIEFRVLNNGTRISGSSQIVIQSSSTGDQHGITVTNTGSIIYDGKI